MNRINLEAPVLLICWKRPHLTKQVIDAIRVAGPARMFVACDGPNPDSAGEAKKVNATRELIDREIDWDCTIERRYSDVNQGCRLGVSNAISWFFDHVEEGIILEDDCVPHPEFFAYCEELLKRYRHDTRVWSIGGSNFQDGLIRGDGSYYFSKYNHCWGWASWKRCWDHYDLNLKGWETAKQKGVAYQLFDDDLEREWWFKIWDCVLAGETETWDVQWFYTCIANGGLTALPNMPLVTNIGFGADATRTLTETAPQKLPPGTILPISHPLFVRRDSVADRYTMQKHYHIIERKETAFAAFKRHVKRIVTGLRCCLWRS